MSAPVNIGLVGAAGRMGQRLCQALVGNERFALAGVLEHTRPASVPTSLSPMRSRDPLAIARLADVVIDFSAPSALASVLPACVAAKTPYVIASTDLGPVARGELIEAGQSIPLLQSANLSLGVHVMTELLQRAVSALPDFRLELIEAHHRHKVDAPSGTALALRFAACEARPGLRAASGDASRQPTATVDEVAVHAIRGGDVAGDHHAWLIGDGERLEIVHRSHDGSLFARGALHAAAWLQGQPPGLYSMRDMLTPASRA